YSIVAIHTDDEQVCLRPGFLQVLDMARVQQVEAAVGKRDPLAGAAAAFQLVLERCEIEDFAGGRGVQQVAQEFVAGDGGGADLFDLQPARYVRQPDRRVVVGARGQRQAEHAQYHVAGAGDVVNVPRPGREMLASAVGVGQGHAVAVERDNARLHVQL